MKQKYHIWKNVKDKNLLIREFAVLTASPRKQKFPAIQEDDFALLCEQTYPANEIKKASATGRDELILLLRNQNFFPINLHIDKIAAAVIALYASEGKQHEDLIFDDKEVLLSSTADLDQITEIKDETESVDDVDDLLKDNSESNTKNVSNSTNSDEQFNEEKNYSK